MLIYGEVLMWLLFTNIHATPTMCQRQHIFKYILLLHDFVSELAGNDRVASF